MNLKWVNLVTTGKKFSPSITYLIFEFIFYFILTLFNTEKVTKYAGCKIRSSITANGDC